MIVAKASLLECFVCSNLYRGGNPRTQVPHGLKTQNMSVVSKAVSTASLGTEQR